MKRKILALALALCMILTMMPVGIFAEEVEYAKDANVETVSEGVKVGYSYKNGSDSVEIGETIDIVISLENSPATKAVGVGLNIDDSVFEFVSGKWLLKGSLLTDIKIDEKRAAFLSTSEIDPNGDIFIVTLKAKENVEQRAHFISVSVSIGASTNVFDSDSIPVCVYCEHTFDGITDFYCNKCEEKREIAALSILSAPKKTKYMIGEEFDPTGGVVRLGFRDGAYFDVAMTKDNMFGFDSSVSGSVPVNFRYTENGYDVGGVGVDVEILPVKGGIKADSSTVVEGSEIEFTVSLANCPDNKAVGVEFIFDESIFELVSAKWLIKGLLVDVKLDEKKAAFLDDEAASRNGDILSFVLRVKDGAKLGNNTVGAVIKAANVSGGNYDVEDVEVAVEIKCAHKYDGPESRQCKKCLETRTPVSIAVTSKPNKLEYLEGKDSFDVNGGQITITYNNGTVGVIEMTAANVSGFDNTVVGVQNVAITYEGLKTSLEVTVKAKTPISVIVKTLPNKVEYLEGKDVLNCAGGKLLVTYDNGTVREVVLTEENISGFDNTKVGKQTLNVTYTEKDVTLTASFEIVIKAKSVESLKIEVMPEKLEYKLNEETLSVDGAKIKVIYDNGTTEIIDVTLAMTSGFDNTKAGKQLVVITYAGKTVSFSVEVIEYVLGDTMGDGIVDSDDAIHLLYSILFGGDEYTLNQKCDFDGNGVTDSDDAIYLLYHVLFGAENYPLN